MLFHVGALSRGRLAHPSDFLFLGFTTNEVAPPLRLRSGPALRGVRRVGYLEPLPRKGLSFPGLQFCAVLFVYHHRSWFAVSIPAEAAPRPLLRFQHQSPFHGVAMHVSQLLDPLGFATNHKVVITLLPDVAGLDRFLPE